MSLLETTIQRKIEKQMITTTPTFSICRAEIKQLTQRSERSYIKTKITTSLVSGNELQARLVFCPLYFPVSITLAFPWGSSFKIFMGDWFFFSENRSERRPASIRPQKRTNTLTPDATVKLYDWLLEINGTFTMMYEVYNMNLIYWRYNWHWVASLSAPLNIKRRPCFLFFSLAMFNGTKRDLPLAGDSINVMSLAKCGARGRASRCARRVFDDRMPGCDVKLAAWTTQLKISENIWLQKIASKSLPPLSLIAAAENREWLEMWECLADNSSTIPPAWRPHLLGPWYWIRLIEVFIILLNLVVSSDSGILNEVEILSSDWDRIVLRKSFLGVEVFVDPALSDRANSEDDLGGDWWSAFSTDNSVLDRSASIATQ